MLLLTEFVAASRPDGCFRRLEEGTLCPKSLAGIQLSGFEYGPLLRLDGEVSSRTCVSGEPHLRVAQVSWSAIGKSVESC